MKKTKKLAIAIGIMIVAIMILYSFTNTSNFDGLCEECRGYMVKKGSVFPYTQYKCVDCGHIQLD